MVRLRSQLYRSGLLKSTGFDIPVIIVGNLTVGGTGKTPITIWLGRQLKKRGYKPGIVSRGYGGRVGNEPVVVFAASDTLIVGDEAVLMARRAIAGASVALRFSVGGAKPGIKPRMFEKKT